MIPGYEDLDDDVEQALTAQEAIESDVDEHDVAVAQDTLDELGITSEE